MLISLSISSKTVFASSHLPRKALELTKAMSDFPPNLSIRPLTVEDLDQCVELENKGFPEDEKASREMLKYRLIACPELCSGLFIREYGLKYNAINLPEVAEKLKAESGSQEFEKKEDKEKKDNKGNDDEEEEVSLPVKLSVVKETLIGHITATKTPTQKLTKAAMELPSKENKDAGHVEFARNIAIHGLVIDPEWRGKNLGTLLMHDYIQKLSNQDLGSKVILVAHKELIPFYEKIGFEYHGESNIKHGAETWYDLSIDLVPQEEE